MKKWTFSDIGIIIGLVLWVLAIIQDDDFGMVRAMLLIVVMHVIKIDSELSKLKKEKEGVSK